MDYNKIKELKNSQNSQDGIINNKISNPIDNSKIMPLNTRTSSNRLYGGWAHSFAKNQDIDYLDIVSSLNSAIISQKDSVKLFYALHKTLCAKLALDFIAIGIYNQTSNYVNVKLVEKAGSAYNSKVMLSDDENVIVSTMLIGAVSGIVSIFVPIIWP